MKPPGQTNTMTTKTQRPRDIEKSYSTAEFVAKLRRLADALEAGRPYAIQIAGQRVPVPARALFNIEHECEGGTEEIEFQLKWKRSRSTRKAMP